MESNITSKPLVKAIIRKKTKNHSNRSHLLASFFVVESGCEGGMSMRIINNFFIGLILVLLLTACSDIDKREDIIIKFDDFSECPEDRYDDIVVQANNLPDKIENGYLYIYTSDDDSSYGVVLRNPNYDFGEEEFKRNSYGLDMWSIFVDGDDEYFERIMISSNYYLYEINYRNSPSSCVDDDIEQIILDFDNSFVFYSEEYYTESEFRNKFPSMFE